MASSCSWRLIDIQKIKMICGVLINWLVVVLAEECHHGGDL